MHDLQVYNIYGSFDHANHQSKQPVSSTDHVAQSINRQCAQTDLSRYITQTYGRCSCTIIALILLH